MIRGRTLLFFSLLTTEVMLAFYLIGNSLQGKNELVGIIQALTGIVGLIIAVTIPFIKVERPINLDSLVNNSLARNIIIASIFCTLAAIMAFPVRLGGMQVLHYCQDKYNNSDKIQDVQVVWDIPDTKEEVMGCKITESGEEKYLGIDLNNLCREQYNNLAAYAAKEGYHKWTCYTRFK